MPVTCLNTNSPRTLVAPGGAVDLDLRATSSSAAVAVDVVYTITGPATFANGTKIDSLHAASVGVTPTDVRFRVVCSTNGAAQFGIMGRLYVQGSFQDNAYWQVAVAGAGGDV